MAQAAENEKSDERGGGRTMKGLGRIFSRCFLKSLAASIVTFSMVLQFPLGIAPLGMQSNIGRAYAAGSPPPPTPPPMPVPPPSMPVAPPPVPTTLPPTTVPVTMPSVMPAIPTNIAMPTKLAGSRGLSSGPSASLKAPIQMPAGAAPNMGAASPLSSLSNLVNLNGLNLSAPPTGNPNVGRSNVGPAGAPAPLNGQGYSGGPKNAPQGVSLMKSVTNPDGSITTSGTVTKEAAKNAPSNVKLTSNPDGTLTWSATSPAPSQGQNAPQQSQQLQGQQLKGQPQQGQQPSQSDAPVFGAPEPEANPNQSPIIPGGTP